MKASIKSKYEGGASGEAATTTLAVGVGDLKLKASCTDLTFAKGTPSLHGVTVGVEKPGSFMIDHEIQSQSTRFQFMNAAKIGGKQVKLTYIHPQKRNATVVEGTLSIDSRNKVTGKYSFASESWNFSVSKKFAANQTVKAVYETHQKVLGIEWVNEDKKVGAFKLAAIVNVENKKPPKLIMEKTWNYEF